MGGNNHEYGKKGSCLGKGIIGLVIFLLLLIWIYWKNQTGIPH
ncbi:MAG: hypothetical protein V3V14_09910 [Saprospiraceae bacterium]